MLSLYIHVPYCVGKCPYCGFYSTPYVSQEADNFISAFNIEADICRKKVSSRHIGSIYMGGGTPTILSLDQIKRLIDVVKRCFTFEHGVEFTVEANPGTLTGRYLACLLEQGVNRLSLGVQSFSDKVLQTLGRIHTVAQALDAFRCARTAGFKNIGIDLIFGILGQTAGEWEQTIDAARALKPEHLSIYSLSLDKGSQFAQLANRNGFVLLEDEIVARMYEQAVRLLSSAGYDRYEVSNFSLPGFACAHNQHYWRRGGYLGLGPGASSFLDEKRYENIADSAEYARRLFKDLPVRAFEETVEADSAARETLLLGLRTVEGVDLRRFGRQFGAALLSQIKEKARPLESAGLLTIADEHLYLTDRGFLLLDEVLKRLYT
jgi:oxygen-independent coproporphyrinogen-3 oxidase